MLSSLAADVTGVAALLGDAAADLFRNIITNLTGSRDVLTHLEIRNLNFIRSTGLKAKQL